MTTISEFIEASGNPKWHRYYGINDIVLSLFKVKYNGLYTPPVSSTGEYMYHDRDLDILERACELGNVSNISTCDNVDQEDIMSDTESEIEHEREPTQIGTYGMLVRIMPKWLRIVISETEIYDVYVMMYKNRADGLLLKVNRVIVNGIVAKKHWQFFFKNCTELTLQYKKHRHIPNTLVEVYQIHSLHTPEIPLQQSDIRRWFIVNS